LESGYDVVVIGAGTAGLVAANRAIENGARVLLLEKLAAPGGTLPITSGFLFHADPARDEIKPAYQPRLDGMVSRDFEPAMAWLRECGIHLAESGNKHGGYKIDPDPSSGALVPLLDRFRNAGGVLVLDAAVRSLEVSASGAVEGVRLKADSRVIRAGAVVIATGGFQGDPELVSRYIAPWEKIFWRSNPGTTGDGFRMGLAAGVAATAGLGTFVGHLNPSTGRGVVDLEPAAYRRSTLACIKDVVLLNLAGKRFVDESHQDSTVVRALARDHHAVAIAVFDAVVRERYAKLRQPLPGDTRTAFEQWRDLGARVATSDTLSGLFEQLADLGLPVDTAAATMEEYDRAAATGTDRALPVARRKHLHRCATAPFFAMLVCPDITFTEGGLRVGDKCQAVDNDGDDIKGLYVVGEAAGLVALASQAGGLATAVTTGWRAGHHASVHALRRAA
jgi:succinate dehydrogenase/fumarate reductase flavoprotein subunit